MYFVIFSKSPYLLARLCVLLQMAGKGLNENFNSDPFTEGVFRLAMFRNKIYFLRTEGQPEAIRLWITEKNHVWVLSTIIDNKK